MSESYAPFIGARAGALSAALIICMLQMWNFRFCVHMCIALSSVYVNTQLGCAELETLSYNHVHVSSSNLKWVGEKTLKGHSHGECKILVYFRLQIEGSIQHE